jgi:hypothetical protein
MSSSKKLKIKESAFDINLVFYNFLKKITQAKLTDNQASNILSLCISNKGIDIDKLKDILYNHVEANINRQDTSSLTSLLEDIESNTLEIFILSLRLNIVKDLLLEEAKIAQAQKLDRFKGLNQLSLAYDKVSIQSAYGTRISGALLSLMFFEEIENGNVNILSQSSKDFLISLAQQCKALMKKGLEPNQIFMLLFSESINQSITSTAGVSYEDRIMNILISIGVPLSDITKTHDKVDSSTEFDFFFNYAGKTYGIGAKRTLRERYKQFIKTANMSKLDVMIEITLGTDLRPNIANSIRKHGVYLFVADEVYNSKEFLRDTEGIYPASSLNLNLLRDL